MVLGLVLLTFWAIPVAWVDVGGCAIDVNLFCYYLENE